MGCITSKGKEWPPKPYKRRIVVTRCVKTNNAFFDDSNVSDLYYSEESYVWEYPGPRHIELGGVRCRSDDDASPAQEIAIRILEDN
jgi:hypothetical protein